MTVCGLYKKGAHCIDAVILLIHDITMSHLGCKETTIAKVLSLDFSSALNNALSINN